MDKAPRRRQSPSGGSASTSGRKRRASRAAGKRRSGPSNPGEGLFIVCAESDSSSVQFQAREGEEAFAGLAGLASCLRDSKDYQFPKRALTPVRVFARAAGGPCAC